MIEFDKLTPRQREALIADESGSFEQCKALAAVTVPEGDEHYHVLLQCYVRALFYDWKAKRGDVWCAGCTDMSGAIALFEAIDADVKLILTYWDGKPDVVYRKGTDGAWTARTAVCTTQR
jgi:hypothetical protein